jgi:hypothetical protein
MLPFHSGDRQSPINQRHGKLCWRAVRKQRDAHQNLQVRTDCMAASRKVNICEARFDLGSACDMYAIM